MNKIESIARRVLGWKLNRWDDYEKGMFIHDTEFQPERNLEHAMLIVERLEHLGYSYKTNGVSEAFFSDVYATGETLAQAITNAAYSIIEMDSRRIWNQLY
jgi:hypothetical protein